MNREASGRMINVLSFDVGRCHVMSSKKAPLWLTCRTGERFHRNGTAHANETVTAVLFKDGDDLRQDQLTLAVMKVIENCWLNAGLDLADSLRMCEHSDCQA